MIRHYYDLGIYPDWWKLEPLVSKTAWRHACEAIEANDPHVRGVVVLGLEASEEALRECFRSAAQFPLVKGFAVGRTIFAEAAKAYMAGKIAPDAAVTQMAGRYARLCAIWDEAREGRETAR